MELAIYVEPGKLDQCHHAMAALKEDFSPLSDVRASGAYRLTVAANLLQRFWLETGDSKPGATPPLRLESLRPIRPGAPAQGARP